MNPKDMNLGGIFSELVISGPLCLGTRDPQSIKKVQHALNEKLGPMFGKLDEDGVFGPKTDQMVRTFQALGGLKMDGIVGPITSQALGLLYVTRGPVPAPPKPKPSRPGGQPIPPIPGGAPSAAGDLVEAVVQGLGEVQRGIVAAIRELTPSPSDIFSDLVQSIVTRFNSTVATLRGAARIAMAAGNAVGQMLGNAIRSALGSYVSSVQTTLEGILRLIPDVLGLGDIAAKIRRIIQKLQSAVNHIIDLVIKTLRDAAISLVEATTGILSVLAGVASGA